MSPPISAPISLHDTASLLDNPVLEQLECGIQRQTWALEKGCKEGNSQAEGINDEPSDNSQQIMDKIKAEF